MATPSYRLIKALRETACTLDKPDVIYKWSSFAHCNCGHLIQTITGMDTGEIQRRAMTQERDWGMQAISYARKSSLPSPPQPDFGDRPALDEGAWEPVNTGACTVSGMSLDLVFDYLKHIGLNPVDIENLERLADPKIRQRLGTSGIHYPHHLRENVTAYLRCWADLLEEQLPVRPKKKKKQLAKHTTDKSQTSPALSQTRDRATPVAAMASS